MPQPVRDAIKLETDKRSPEQQQQIRRYFLTSVYSVSRRELEPLQKQIDDLNKQIADAADPIRTLLPRGQVSLLRSKLAGFDDNGDPKLLEHPAEVDQRIADGGHVPVEDGDGPVGIVGGLGVAPRV